MKKYLKISSILFILSALSNVMAENINKPYQAVIFDVDGVLVDTEQLKYEAWQEALQERSIDFQITEYYPLVGLSSEAILQNINKQKKINMGEDLINTKELYYRKKQLKGVPILHSAAAFLKKLINFKKKNKIKLALASSAPLPEIIENIKQMGFTQEDFDIIASGKDSLNHIKDPSGVNKPKPYIYQLVSQKLNISPKSCIVFEDTNAGVIAAAEAGMDVIAVPNIFTKDQDFSRALQITSFENLTVDSFIKN